MATTINLSIRFTSDSTRFNACHVVALWFVKSNGTLWTPNNNQYPYLWLVASGETVLSHRKNFDRVLNDVSLNCNSLCFLLQNCDIKKARVMVIPCCRLNLPQDNTLSSFINSLNSSGSEGHIYINTSGSSWLNLANQIHTIAAMSSTPPHGIGEAYMDVNIVNQQFYRCKSILYQVSGTTTITDLNTTNLKFSSCFKTCNDSLSTHDSVLFPVPKDLSSNNVTFSLDLPFAVELKLCVFDNFPFTFSNGLSGIDIRQITDPDSYLCCDLIAEYDSISYNGGSTAKLYLWYQNGDVTSPNFGQVEGLVLNNTDSINTLVVMKNTLLVFHDSDNDNTITTSDLVYFNSVLGYNNSGINISQPLIKNINCQP